jgi:hypothetical protein
MITFEVLNLLRNGFGLRLKQGFEIAQSVQRKLRAE